MIDNTKLPTMREMTDRAFARLTSCEFGQRLSYADLTAVCGADAQLTRTRAAVLRAGRQLLRDHQKLLVNVRNEGYAVARPEEHVAESQRQQRSASRKLRRSLASVIYVRLEGMTAEEVNKVLAEQTRCALKVGMDRRLTRVRKLPKRQDVEVPSGRNIVEMMARRK